MSPRFREWLPTIVWATLTAVVVAVMVLLVVVG